MRNGYFFGLWVAFLRHALHSLHPSFLIIKFSALYSCPCGQWVFARCLAPLAKPPTANPFLQCLRSGFITSDNGNPFSILAFMLSPFIPSCLATSATKRSTPSTRYTTVHSRLEDCSLREAHRQLSFEYPRLLFILSSVYLGGLSPISLTNLWKSVFHSSHTVMPRPPYLWYDGLFVFLQRSSILCHTE